MSDLQTETVNFKHRRRPWSAVGLSLILPGFGHLYCGRLVRGLAFAAVSLLFPPVLAVIVLSQLPAPLQTAIFAAVAALAMVAVAAVAAVDAFHLARHTRGDYRLKEYNRWYVYVLLLVISTGGNVGYSLYVRAKYLQAFHIAADSMYPSIAVGDRVLANKVAYAATGPARGDVIVFPNPDDRRIRFIKRVVALEGDTVEIKDGVLIVNDEPLQRRPLPETSEAPRGAARAGTLFRESNADARYRILLSSNTAESKADSPRTIVPKHHCFVLGDNRNRSRDSRAFGPVPLAGIVGRVDYLYWPAHGWAGFGRID